MEREVAFDTDVNPMLVLGRDENATVLVKGKRHDIVVQLPPILPPTRSRTIVVQETVDMARTIQVRTGDYGADGLRVVHVVSSSGASTREVFMFDDGRWEHR